MVSVVVAIVESIVASLGESLVATLVVTLVDELLSVEPAHPAAASTASAQMRRNRTAALCRCRVAMDCNPSSGSLCAVGLFEGGAGSHIGIRSGLERQELLGQCAEFPIRVGVAGQWQHHEFGGAHGHKFADELG